MWHAVLLRLAVGRWAAAAAACPLVKCACVFLPFVFEPPRVSGAVTLFFVYSCFASLHFVLYVPGTGPKWTYDHVCILQWILLAVCRSVGAAVAAACCLVLNLHAHKSCTALLLLLLYLCILYFYGLPFVVGLPLLLLAVDVDTCINMLALSSQRSRGPV